MEFSVPINQFQTLGIYNYKFDEVGNVIADSSSMEFSYNYLSLPLWNSNYDNNEIESYYNVNFVEFIAPSPIIESGSLGGETTVPNLSETLSTNQQLSEENAALTDRINELVSLSEEDSSVAQNEAVKQVILELRIALKEGKDTSEFSEEFPYTPLNPK